MNVIRFVAHAPDRNDFGGPREVSHFFLFASRKVDGVGPLASVELMAMIVTGMSKVTER